MSSPQSSQAGHGPDHDHDHDHDDPRALRAEALEAILIERGLVDPARIDDVLDYFENQLGPLHGARLVARAWTDPEFRDELLRDGTTAMESMGLGGPQVDHLVVVENADAVHNVVVCTLCSCYPWGLLGLPPAWYKSFAYRARIVREPRAVLAEMGCAVPDDVEIRVWDSSAEVRYLVLPQRPADTDHLGADELAAVVTRDHMIGVMR
ncbi:MAG: nthA [Ilumatobacteraceae bacterium]|nr:nthA [Ilumatobacteraceae bacterium]